jgi:four helix bundle protein
MKYARFEDLPVWRSAANVGKRVLLMTDDPAFARRRGIADQIERASVSISNNIAEGFELGTTTQLINFLYHARGSAGEVRSMLRLLGRVPAFSNLKSEISDLIPICESVSRQLRAWADHLQNCKIEGQRHLTVESKADFDRRARARAFLEQLKKATAHLPHNNTP